MEIGSEQAVLYDVNGGKVLVQSMSWGVEMKSNGVWVPVDWSITPVISQEDIGSYHTVVVRGTIIGALIVSLYFDARSTDVPQKGVAVSAELQSIGGFGNYRIVWKLDGVAARYFQLQNSAGNSPSLIGSPIQAVDDQPDAVGIADSLVALSPDLKSVRFGLHWADALSYYSGATVTGTQTGSLILAYFGEFSLALGETHVVPLCIDGSPGDCVQIVRIYSVQVAKNSQNGNLASISWVDSPSGCDRFDWGTTTSYGNTIYPACGTHSVSLSGLSPHRTYYFQITASYSGYYNGVYGSSFAPTDVSTSRAYESYYRNEQFGTFCGTITDQISYSTEMPGDIEYDPSQVGNANHYQVYELDFHFNSLGQQYCWPWTLGAKYTQVDLWVYDPSGVINWINSKGNIIYSGSAGGSDTVSWTVFFQGGSQNGQVGFSATTTPSQVPLVSNNMQQNVDQGGGWKYVGNFKFNWPMQIQVAFDVVVPMIVTDQVTQYRAYDVVNFKVQDTVTYDGFNGSWWAGNDITIAYPAYMMGDGDYNGSTLLDQYTDVQQGTSTALVQ